LKSFILVDPFHDYAARFASAAAAHGGYRAICIHTKGRRGFERRLEAFPVLAGAIHVFEEAGNLRERARALAREHSIAGAIPFNEAVLAPTLEVLRGLQSTWNDESVLSLLRDKFAIKERLRAIRPSLSVGVSHRSPKHPALLPHDLPERFVLKPNGGYGNVAVGFFTRNTPPEEIEAFLQKAPTSDFVLEEFHPGVEYFVNGQTDHQAATTTFAVFCYERVWANGFQVDWLTSSATACTAGSSTCSRSRPTGTSTRASGRLPSSTGPHTTAKKSPTSTACRSSGR